MKMMVWTIRVTACLVVAVSLLSSTGCASKYAYYGEKMKLTDQKTVGLAKVMAEPDHYAGQYLRVLGKVTSVCAKKGCWLRMTDETGAADVFVKFSCPVEGGRLIPMEAVGHDVVVEGTLLVEEISEADARHYKEDAGASPEEIAKIVGPQPQVRMSAPAARILGLTG